MRTGMHKRSPGFMLLFAALLVAGCSGTATSSGGGAASAGASQGSYKVALLVSDFSNDHSWGQANTEAVKAGAAAAGATVIGVGENVVTSQQAEEQGAAFAGQGADLIVVANGGVADAIQKLATQFPKTMFCELGATIDNMPKNLCTYSFSLQTGPFVAGALAGLLTKTNRVGVIFSADFPALTGEGQGFILGARYVNPDITSAETFINTPSDVAVGQAGATAQIATGADFIFACTDAATRGIVAAAQAKKGTYVIAQYFESADLGPDVVLTTALDGLQVATSSVVQLGASGQLTNKNYPYGPDAESVKLTGYGALASVVPADVQKKVEAIQAALVSGALAPPFLPKSGMGQSYDVSKLPRVPGLD
jgi:basic membrane protein A and related proteins